MTDNRIPIRAIRIPNDLWQDARNVAASQGRGVSAMVRECLTKSIEAHKRKTAP